MRVYCYRLIYLYLSRQLVIILSLNLEGFVNT